MAIAGLDRLFCLFWLLNESKASKVGSGRVRQTPLQCPTHTHILLVSSSPLKKSISNRIQRWTSQARMSSSTSCSVQWRTSPTTATSSSTTCSSGPSSPQTATLMDRCRTIPTWSEWRPNIYHCGTNIFNLKCPMSNISLDLKLRPNIYPCGTNICPVCVLKVTSPALYQVSQDEFGGMISAAAALPKKFGFDWWQVSMS